MTTKRKIRCAIYTRKSTEEGLEQDFNSLDAQREACEAYIASQKAEGWIALPGHYDDGGYSGGTLDRPALQRLLADIEAGIVDVVVVYKIDRLSRSLMDFAKLVEVFDRKNVTFVSVTQSFNTTTSMGRLTLNVLLSFAQFEREVTGERIRDKFAASKKKGMWMGGTPPLGYDVANRKLVVNEEEAETVRLIFRRYLDLRCVRRLKADLAGHGILSKRWTSTAGIVRGGTPFDRGALYHLLKNRLYLGQIAYKGQIYPGEHKAIVPHELFDAVQAQMADSRSSPLGKARAKHDSLLTGILFDGFGRPMTPSYSVNPKGRRYRYYISRELSDGPASDAPVCRISAGKLESIVRDLLARLIPSPEPAIPDVVERVDLNATSLAIRLNREAIASAPPSADTIEHGGADSLARLRRKLRDGEALTEQGQHLILTLPGPGVRARSNVQWPNETEPQRPDPALIVALARAHQWKGLLLTGKAASIDALAASIGSERTHVSRTLKLAFLSPELTKAILHGRQPDGLRLAQLLDGDIPLSWKAQKETVMRLAARP